MYEKAIQLDPGYALAISKYALTYTFEYWWNWTDSPKDALKEAMKAAKRAIAADPNEPWAHYALAFVYLIQKKHDQAIPALRRAHELNPNDAQFVTEYGWALALAGRPEEGIPLMYEAIRLNPYHPEWYLVSLGEGYFVAGQYDEAIAELERITQPWSHVYKVLAANYAQVGRLEDARAAAAKFVEIEPQTTVELAVERMPFKRQEDLDRFGEALRKAGLPEKPPEPGA